MMKQNGKARALIKFAVSAAVALGGLFLLQRLLVPKYVDGIVEGAFIAEYYGEKDRKSVV